MKELPTGSTSDERPARVAPSTLDLVLFALLACGGDSRFVGTDEVALQAFKLFPLKFCWDTLTHLPNWDRARQWLSEAKKEKHGSLVEGFSGDRREGWRLTAAGVRRLRFKQEVFKGLRVEAVDPHRYAHLPPGDIVTYALAEVESSTQTASLATLTAFCARRFPVLFELAGYPGWPDSATVDDALRAAIDSGLATDHAGTFALTKGGATRADNVRSAIDSDTVSVRLEDIGRGLTHRAAKAVDELTNSRAWGLFKQARPISDGLACEAIQCSLQSHPKAVRRALDDFAQAAKELNRPDVLKFLSACAQSLGTTLS